MNEFINKIKNKAFFNVSSTLWSVGGGGVELPKSKNNKIKRAQHANFIQQLSTHSISWTHTTFLHFNPTHYIFIILKNKNKGRIIVTQQ